MPNAPEPARREAQYQQVTVGAQDPVNLTQQRVRRLRPLERVGQQHRIDRVARDAKLFRVADQVGPGVEPPVEQRAPLGPGVAQERAVAAPGADLEELLAEHPLEGAANQPLLVREAAAPERRREPVGHAGRVAIHSFDPA